MRRLVELTGEPLATCRLGDDGALEVEDVRQGGAGVNVFVSGEPTVIPYFADPYETLLAERSFITSLAGANSRTFDMKRRLYFTTVATGLPTFEDYADFFVPRLAEPTVGVGQTIPEETPNLAYHGLNITNANGFLANADVAITIVEMADLPSDVRAYYEGIPTRWPVERVFRIEAISGTAENLTISVPPGLTGNHVVSAFCWGITGTSFIRVGSVNSTAIPVGSGARVSSTTSNGGCSFRMNTVGAAFYTAGIQFEAGTTPTAYKDGYQILNRLELRDTSFITGNLRAIVQAKFPVEGDTTVSVISFSNAARTKRVLLSVNWPGSAVSLTAVDGASQNSTTAGGMSWSPDLPVIFDIFVGTDGEVRLRVDGGQERVIESGDVGFNTLDMTGLTQVRLGGQFPPNTLTEFNVAPLEGILEFVQIQGGAS